MVVGVSWVPRASSWSSGFCVLVPILVKRKVKRRERGDVTSGPAAASEPRGDVGVWTGVGRVGQHSRDRGPRWPAAVPRPPVL